MHELVWLNGEFVERSRATISIDDRSFLLGDGLFETMRAYEGQIFLLANHLERLKGGLARMEIRLSCPLPELGAAAEVLVSRNGLQAARVRLTVSRGVPDGHHLLADFSKPYMTNIVITAVGLHEREDVYARGWRAMIFSQPLAATPVPELKSTSYALNLLAKSAAVKAGLDEALLLNSEGRISEGSMSNVFWIEKGVVLTPPLSEGCLAGVTRDAVLMLAGLNNIPAREEGLTIERLHSADEVFVTSSIMELVPVCEIDGRAIGEGRPGQRTQQLHRLYRDHVQQCLKTPYSE